MRKLRLLFLAMLMLGALVDCTAAPAPSTGKATAPSSVYIQNKGSDTLVNLALAWAETYQNENPNVRLSVTGGGSGAGLTSLLNKTIDIANASRAITQGEIDQAKKNGLDPQEFVVAKDAIAVIVNPANPVKRLTLEQISKIYRGDYNNWQEVGGENRPIVRLSRETNSGTHVYFLESVIRLGNKKDKTLFAMDTLLLPSSEGIFAEVRDNPNAIGYDGLGYVTPEVSLIAIAKTNQSEYVLPSAESVKAGTYPISRDLYMYTQNKPEGAIKTYLDWIKSAEAQQIVSKLGFVPLAKAP